MKFTLIKLNKKSNKIAYKTISLATQIKKVIGNRILFCCTAFMIIILGLTLYDLSISVNQLRSRIDEEIKPIEDFAIDQAIINNLDTIKLKIESFNDRHSTFKIEWMRHGIPKNTSITWHFPFIWTYDYHINDIAGYQFGFFKITGNILSDKTLIYDLLLRLILLTIFIISILSILYPLAKKIPEQLFINPVNRFIDLVSNNAPKKTSIDKNLPIELKLLEEKILALLKTATDHEKNIAAIELGHLSARLAHDIYSPLAAMEISISMLTQKVCSRDLLIITNGIQSIRDIANNVLERYRNPIYDLSASSSSIPKDDGNLARPILLFIIIEMILSQKRIEWHQSTCKLIFTVTPEAKTTWILAAPNEVKRLLSNLLNNAYEALSETKNGIIKINLQLLQNNIHLLIEDNGIGIPSEKILDVLNGLSLKHHGKGLGLSSAQHYMNEIGGDILLTSINGTQVKLIFPKADNITWFSTFIRIEKSSPILVIDDDFSMLVYWEQRIAEIGMTPKLFSTYNKALDWIEKNKELASSATCLVDYELADNTGNGLMFLEKINSNNRYLITSHAQDIYFQKSAAEAGIWLIPKALANETKLIH